MSVFVFASAERQNNPFTSVFGKVPAYMAGRERIIEDVVGAFEDGTGNPSLCSIFIGARGTGKTALLTYLTFEAEQRGWISVGATSNSNMLEDIYEGACSAAAHLVDSDKASKKLTGINIATIGGVSWENASTGSANWRTQMNNLLDALAELDAGLLITVDEVDPSLEQMARLVTVYQHFVRENRKVALLMAGLPHRVLGLLSGKSTSFLRRASQYKLGDIPFYEVEEAFRLTVQHGGKADRPQMMDKAGRKTAWISTYKRRLLDAGVIDEARDAYTFVLSDFRDYVLRNKK